MITLQSLFIILKIELNYNLNLPFSDLDVKSLTWPRVNEMYPENYPNILAVMDLILTIPGNYLGQFYGFNFNFPHL